MSRDASRGAVLLPGLYAGLIGYAVVVVFFAAVNVLAGRSPFHTAALFGAVVFYGLEDPAALAVTAGPVLAYNMLHMLAFLVLGVGGSWLVSMAERHPASRYLALFVLVFVFAHVVAGLVLFAQPLPTVGWWHLAAATLLAAVTMVWYLAARHPVLVRELRSVPIGSDEEADHA